MSIPVIFNKDRALQILEDLKVGRPICPGEPGTWTTHDMLAVAGACLSAAESHGPEAWSYKEIPKTLHPEHAEAAVQNFENGLLAAVMFYCQLFMVLAGNKYDGLFEPEVLALADVKEISECQIDLFTAIARMLVESGGDLDARTQGGYRALGIAEYISMLSGNKETAPAFSD